jgi:hypothetical protein
VERRLRSFGAKLGSSHIQGTLDEHSGIIQGTLTEHSGNIQGTFRLVSSIIVRAELLLCAYLGNLHQLERFNEFDDDDDNKSVRPTWAVGALSGVRDVFTSITYIFTYPRH